MTLPSVSVIIPTLNAEGEIGQLLDALQEQSLKPCEILVVDSESSDRTIEIASSRESISVVRIKRSSFNHGTTRHEAFLRTSGEFVCYLTQDALPADVSYLNNLVAPMLRDASISLVSGRQLPKRDARRFVQLVQHFNYSNEPNVRTAEDLSMYGIKTFFASDACSCYRRSAYLSCGGFPSVETNEDMLMAAHLISRGWKVAYEPSAAVLHSHNLTPPEQFARNRAVGRFLEKHSSELMGANEVGEGGRLVKCVATELIRERCVGELFAFAIDCAARFAGNRMGRHDVRKGGRP